MYTTSAYQWRSEGRPWPDGQSRMFVPLMSHDLARNVHEHEANRLAVCMCVTSMIKVALIVEISRSFRMFVRVTSMVEIVCEISKNLILILYRSRDFSFYLCEKKKEKRDEGYESVCTCNFNGQDCL